jgi:hypothetical protein
MNSQPEIKNRGQSHETSQCGIAPKQWKLHSLHTMTAQIIHTSVRKPAFVDENEGVECSEINRDTTSEQTGFGAVYGSDSYMGRAQYIHK